MISTADQGFFYKRLGELLKDARVKANIKQESLAKYLGLNRVSIVNIEKGRQKPQIHTLVEISIYLNVPLENILDPLTNSLGNNFNHELEHRITNEIGTDNIDDIKKIKEFYRYTQAKKNGK